MKHKALIVLKYLLQGGEIKDQGFTFCMSENDELCWNGTTEEKTPLLFKADWNFNGFIKFCEKLSHEEVAVMAMDMALKETYGRDSNGQT